jgi:hypothetical protein
MLRNGINKKKLTHYPRANTVFQMHRRDRRERRGGAEEKSPWRATNPLALSLPPAFDVRPIQAQTVCVMRPRVVKEYVFIGKPDKSIGKLRIEVCATTK